MSSTLDKVSMRICGRLAPSCPWHLLRYMHTHVIRAWLADTYAPATANRALAGLRGVLREARRFDLMSTDDYITAVDLERVRGSRLPAGRALEPDELRKLFGACDRSKPSGVRSAAMVGVLYAGGLRRAELVDLNLSALDASAGSLRLRGKGNKERLVYLAAGAMRALSAWIALRGSEPGPMFCRTGRRGLEILIDERLCVESVQGNLERLGKRAGLAHFSPHDMRRTYAGDLLDAGVDLSTVQGLMGHAQPSTTARYDRRGERARARTREALVVPYDD